MDPRSRKRRRDAAKRLIKRLRERRSVRNAVREQHSEAARTRRLKRKTAMALTASVATFSSSALAGFPAVQPAGQPVVRMALPSLEQAPEEQRLPAEHLKTSEDLKEALIEEEGVRLTVYRDVAGYPTVGVGHLVKPSDNLTVGQTISEDRVLALLDQDLAVAERAVRRLVGDLPLYQHEFDALVDLVFNVGEGNVSEHESPKLNAAINARDYGEIAQQLEYHSVGGAIARGLQYRSERRTQMFMDAVYENPREAA
ncbi:lysozyme [Erythrobacter sp. HA6-11]